MTQRLEFTPEIQATLQEERYQHPVPLVQRRMEALWLKSHGLPHRQIAKLTGVSENTLRAYFRLYAAGGLEPVKVVQFHRPESALQTHATSLEAHFQAHPPATVKAAQQDITALTGIRRSASQVRVFLKKSSICAVAGWG